MWMTLPTVLVSLGNANGPVTNGSCFWVKPHSNFHGKQLAPFLLHDVKATVHAWPWGWMGVFPFVKRLLL